MMITGFVVTLLLGFKPSSLEGLNHDTFLSPPGGLHGYAVDSDEFGLTNSGYGDAEADKEEQVSREYLFDTGFYKFISCQHVSLLLF
jgi:hypothetical protein